MTMHCELWQDKIDAFVDAELSHADTASFEEHLRSCPACSAETLARQRMKAETRLAGQRFKPEPALESRIRKQIASKPRREMRWSWAFATATMIVLVVAVSLLVGRQRLLEHQMLGQLVDQHVQALMSSHPVDVSSADARVVKPWFQGKVPFGVDLPVLDGTEYELVGGKVAYFQQDPAAQIIFSDRKHFISVFMFRERGGNSALGSQTFPVKRLGFQTETWVEDGIRYFAVSDVDPRDISRLCELLKLSS